MDLNQHIARVPASAKMKPLLWVVPWLAVLVFALAIHYLGAFAISQNMTFEYWEGVVRKIGVFIIAAVSLNIVNGYTGQFSMGHAGFMAVGAYVAGAVTYYGTLYFHGPIGEPAFYSTGVMLMLIGIVAGAAAAGVFGYLVGLPSLRLRGDYLAIVTLGFGEIIRVILELTRQKVDAGILRGLRDVVGDRGTPLLHSLVDLAPPVPPAGQSVAAESLPTAAQVTQVLGENALPSAKIENIVTLLSSPDASALKAFWNAPISTLAKMPLNGALGFNGIPQYATLFWVVLFVGITCVIAFRLKQSSNGRAFLSIREDEIAARAMGVNLTRYKVRAFVLAAILAGVAGGVMAHSVEIPAPASASFQRSFDIVIFVVLGGLGSMSGAALAAVISTFMSEILRAPDQFAKGWWVGLLIAAGLAGIGSLLRAQRVRGYQVLWFAAAAPAGLIALALVAGAVKDWANVDLSNYRMIVYALLLILVMLLRPNGLLGIREVWDLFTPGSDRGRASPPGDGAVPTTTADALRVSTVSRLGGSR